MSSNPWGDILSGIMGTAGATSQAAAPAQGYPTYANDHGIGTNGAQGASAPQAAAQTGMDYTAIPGAQSSPNYMTREINNPMPDSGSRGFNPWSLQGESNARG